MLDKTEYTCLSFRHFFLSFFFFAKRKKGGKTVLTELSPLKVFTFSLTR